MRKRKILLLSILTVVILVSAVLVFFRKPILISMAEYLIVSSEPEPVGLIVVISGSLPEIHYGIDLYHSGLGENILFLGHFPVELAVLSEDPFEVAELSWDEVAAHMAVAAGIPEEAVLYSDVFTDSTYERAQAFIGVAQEHEIKTILVITDSIHSRRLHHILNPLTANTGITTLLAPTPQNYYPPAYQFDPQHWWQDESDLKSVFEAYIKLAYDKLRY